MDGEAFDRIARGLPGESPRRRVLGGLLGGVLAALGGSSVSAVKRRKRKGHDGKDGDETETELPPGTLAGGIWDETIEICHFNAETGAYEVIPVPTPTVPDYLNAGDTLFIDCCVTAECVALPCLTPSACIEGACAYDPVPGASCALDDGATGVCDDDGDCIASVATSEVITPSA